MDAGNAANVGTGWWVQYIYLVQKGHLPHALNVVNIGTVW